MLSPDVMEEECAIPCMAAYMVCFYGENCWSIEKITVLLNIIPEDVIDII